MTGPSAPGPTRGAARSAGEPLVVLDGVSKRRGALQVLRDVSLTIGRGEVVAVTGPPGAGKSALCRAISGLESVDSGRITVDGMPLPAEGPELDRLRTEVGIVFGSFGLLARKTVLANVMLGLVKVRGVPREQAERTARSVLERVGAARLAGRYPAALSGGQQQRVAIARALATDPKLMLFDEPASPREPGTADEVLTVMRELAREGMTMVVASRQTGFAHSSADRVALMSGGRILAQGPREQFLSRPPSDWAGDSRAEALPR